LGLEKDIMFLTTVVLAMLTFVLPVQEPSKAAPEFYHATAADTTGVSGSSLFEIEITVERYTTTAESETFKAAYDKRRQDGLLSAIQQAPRIGFFRVPGNLSYDLRYAIHFPARDNRRRIILVTDRPVGFMEASERPRSLDYPFLVIDMRVDASGVGEGQIIFPAAVGFERSSELTIEELLDRPIRLTKVRKIKK
jgi:hypothetical protein